MKRFFNLQFQTMLGLVAVLLLAGCASHREPLYQQTPISYSSPLAMHQIERGIMDGCKRRDWNPTKIHDGLIEATLHVREHVAVVRIAYNQQTYTVKYARSENLNYDKRSDGTELIHPNYNRWVQNLIRYINDSLERAERAKS